MESEYQIPGECIGQSIAAGAVGTFTFTRKFRKFQFSVNSTSAQSLRARSDGVDPQNDAAIGPGALFYMTGNSYREITLLDGVTEIRVRNLGGSSVTVGVSGFEIL